jgi:hypothetical protein
MLILDRLGKVLYWVCWFAALQFAVGSALALWSEKPISAVSFALLGFACWVWGWFSKYILIEFVKPALRDFAADAKGRMAPNFPD